MGDFLVKFGEDNRSNSLDRAGEFLRFESQVSVQKVSFPKVELRLSTVDNHLLWSPFDSVDLFIAVCGRIALAEKEWRQAERVEGEGGLAAKYIAASYRESGAGALLGLNGNFTVLLYDRVKGEFLIVTDPAGAAPVFECVTGENPVFGSHPDALAIACGTEGEHDFVSLAEFAFSSRVTPPNSFYKNIKSIPEPTVITIQLKSLSITRKKYYTLEFAPKSGDTEEGLASDLAAALRDAVQIRTLPRLGTSAIALSGGLDSRAILAAISDSSPIFAFCCLDEENLEFQIARAIARAQKVKLVPLSRNFEFYADNAPLGIRISGGMGSFANNHFLGFSASLRELGAENLLTGCYCDYLFKGLVLNRRVSRFLRYETLGTFDEDYYFSSFRLREPFRSQIEERRRLRYPEDIRSSADPAKVYELEKRRSFPLWHEPDNAQRLIPSRVMGNYLPFADRRVLEVYRRVPWQYKLNRSLFKKAATKLCGRELISIPDANTGAPVNASLIHEALSGTVLKARRRLRSMRNSVATDTSWPNWIRYVQTSPKLREYWAKSNPLAQEFFESILPKEDLRPAPADYRDRDTFLFVQLLTLKLWFDQRCSNGF